MSMVNCSYELFFYCSHLLNFLLLNTLNHSTVVLFHFLDHTLQSFHFFEKSQHILWSVSVCLTFLERLYLIWKISIFPVKANETLKRYSMHEVTQNMFKEFYFMQKLCRYGNKNIEKSRCLKRHGQCPELWCVAFHNRLLLSYFSASQKQVYLAVQFIIWKKKSEVIIVVYFVCIFRTDYFSLKNGPVIFERHNIWTKCSCLKLISLLCQSGIWRYFLIFLKGLHSRL